MQKRVCLTLVVLTGLILLAIAGFGWNLAKGPVAWFVSHRTGRPFAITGDLHVRLGRQPRITAEGVVLGNAPWGGAPNMAEISRVTLRVDAWELVKGSVALRELTLSRPRIRLETSADGQPNWDLGAGARPAPGGKGVTLPRIDAISIDHGTVVYRDQGADTDVEMGVSTSESGPPETQTIEARVQGRIAGRDLSIGRLQATMSPVMRITADDVVVANAPWGTRPSMAEIGRVMVQIDAGSLGSGRPVLRELTLSRPDILLERSADGKRNWDLGAGSGPGGVPQLGALVIETGRFGYRDPRSNTHLWFDVATAKGRPGDTQPMMAVKGGGRYKGARFELEGRLGTLLALRDEAQPYPIDIRTRVGETRAVVTGGVTAPLEVRGFEVNLQLEGPDLSRLYPFIPVPLPVTPPYRVAGRLDHVGTSWTFIGFAGRVGDSDLAGDFSVDLGGPRPLMRGSLVSRTLVFRDLAGLVGARPGPQAAAAADPRQRAAEGARRERVLPDEPYRLDRLHAADAEVRFRGERVISALPLDDVTADLVLRDGRLTLRPLNLGVAGGRILSSITMNAQRSPISTAVDLDVQELELTRLFPGFRLKVGSAGLLGGHARLVGRGDSVAEMLGSADGDLVLLMSGGEISRLVLNLADLDVSGSLLSLLTGDKDIPVQCMVADFRAEDGRMAAKTLVLETSHTTVSGDGAIDFKDETLDLRLMAESKRPSLVVLRGPIRVTGRFKEPRMRPDLVRMSLRAGAAAALGTLFPPAAILPLVEVGLGKDRDCTTLVESAVALLPERPG